MVKTRSKVFVDTGGWYSMSATEDRYHAAGVRYYRQVLAQGGQFLTSDYVLDETLTRLRYDLGHRAAIAFHQSIGQAEHSGILSVERVDEAVWESAIGIFVRYHDQDFSFTDCTSFVVAREQGAEQVFTFDHHFLIFGFDVQPFTS